MTAIDQFSIGLGDQNGRHPFQPSAEPEARRDFKIAVEMTDIDHHHHIMPIEKAPHVRHLHDCGQDPAVGAPVGAKVDEQSLVLFPCLRNGALDVAVCVGALVEGPRWNGDIRKVLNAQPGRRHAGNRRDSCGRRNRNEQSSDKRREFVRGGRSRLPETITA